MAFAGNYATQLTVSKGINFLPRKFYALPGQTPPVPSSTLLAQVPNPMAGLLSGSSLNSNTTAYQNLQLPYPEFGGITENNRSLGKSLYNSMQVTVEKRLSGGLQARLSFTWDKIMQQTGYLNDQDDWSQLARAQASEPSKLLSLSVGYDVPFFAHSSRLTHSLLGGWKLNGILRYANGYLISAPGGAYSSGVNPKLESGQSYSQWFNTCSLNTSGVRQNCKDASQPVAFIQTPPYTLRTLSTVLPGIRSEIPTILDISIFKTFYIREGINAQLRANAYNISNTPQFGNPNTSFGSANFGVIGIGQANDPRIVEFALKLMF